MAKELASEEIVKFQEIENKNLVAKKKEFAAKGKTFRQDSYGPGVMPQDLYDKLRNPKDPKYKKP